MAGAFIVDCLAKAAKLRSCRLVLAGDRAESSPYFDYLSQRFGAELTSQGKGHLGQRMARVLRRYSSAGAILMGADTPSLPLSFIRESIKDLREVPVVVAPALDGGYYLIGIRGALPDIFGDLDWGGAGVLRQTVRRLRRLRIPYRIGRWWYDIDRASDLAFLAADLEQRICATDPTSCPATAGLLREMGLLKNRR